MADLTDHADVDLPAQQVWDVIGDFAAISKWASIMLDRSPDYEYRSTIAVIPLDAGHSRMVLVPHVVDPEQDDSALADRYTKFLRGNLKAMRAA